MIVLNCFQVISSWIALCFFFTNIQEWTVIEVGVSGSFLLVGNYIIPGIANLIIYWRRWSRSTIAYRRRTEEENKQAWICLRITLSLLGVPTVGRYIETIMVSRKLDELEKKHLHDSVNTHKEGSQMNPVGASRLGSIINQKNYQKMSKLGTATSMVSGVSQVTTMNETSQEKVRRARRQYKRCEHDGALMALLAGSAGAGPLAVAFIFLYLQRIEKMNMPTDQGAAVIAAAILNVLWLSATLTHFYPARHVQSEAEFERGVSSGHVGSIILLYMSHLIQVVLRIICLSVFANWFYGYVLVFVLFHWLVGTVILVVYRFYMKTKTVGQSMISCSSFLSALFFGYVGIFDFVNGNEGKTRLRYLIYYAFYYLENIIMLVIWIILNPTTQIQFPVPFVCVVLGLFWLGFILLQLYLYYYSYSPYGSSIICCQSDKEAHRKSVNYAEEVRDPVFGVPLSQSAVPLWQHQQSPHGDDGAGSRISGMSHHNNNNNRFLRPMPLNQSHTPSIMSIPSAKTPPSILSQPTSYINLKNEKPRVHPNLKAPPVIEQKSRKDNAKPVPQRDSSSSSSSSSPSEEFQRFTPKLVRDARSHPDLLNQVSTPSSSPITDSTEVKAPFKASRVPPAGAGAEAARSPRLSTSQQGSKSMDHIASMVPAIEPNRHTKPIGYPSKPISSNPGQQRPGHHRTDQRSRNPHKQQRNNPQQSNNIRHAR